MTNPSPISPLNASLGRETHVTFGPTTSHTYPTSVTIVSRNPPTIRCSPGHWAGAARPTAHITADTPTQNGARETSAVPSDDRHVLQGWAATIPTNQPSAAPPTVSVRKCAPRRIRLAAMAAAAPMKIQRPLGNLIARTAAIATADVACPDGNESQPLPPNGERSTAPV